MNETKSIKKSGTFRQMWSDWIAPVGIAFALAILIKFFFIQPFKIPSGSMEDTLLVGDQLLVVKFLYGTRIPFSGKRVLKFRDPRPGDVIVFKFPQDMSKDYIKRCIAVEGQEIEIRDKEVYVDGVRQELPLHAKTIDPSVYPLHMGSRDNMPPETVPPGHVFVLGDNRDNSNDSRYWGYVPCENIKGKAVMLYWSWNKDKDYPLRKIIHSIRWKRFFSLIR